MGALGDSDNSELILDVEQITIYENGTYLLRISGKTENQVLKFIKIE